MEANVCADFMAKLATSDDQGFIVWDVPIKGIASLLLAGQLRTYFHTVVKFFFIFLTVPKKTTLYHDNAHLIQNFTW